MVTKKLHFVPPQGFEPRFYGLKPYILSIRRRGNVGEEGLEPPRLEGTDLQSVEPTNCSTPQKVEMGGVEPPSIKYPQ